MKKLRKVFCLSLFVLLIFSAPNTNAGNKSNVVIPQKYYKNDPFTPSVSHNKLQIKFWCNSYLDVVLIKYTEKSLRRNVK